VNDYCSYPVRKHPRLKQYDYGNQGSYHIIIQTLSDAPPLLQLHFVDEEIWDFSIPRNSLIYDDSVRTVLAPLGKTWLCAMKQAVSRFPSIKKVDDFVIMPTHIHLLLSITDRSDKNVTDYVRYLKSITTITWNKAQGTTGNSVFQKSFYDHIIRGEEDYQETIRYINQNPFKEIQKSPP